MPVKAIAIAAIVLSILAAFGLYSRYLYKAGVDSERRAQVQQSLNRNADRNKDDEELRNTDLDGLCREYGATRWLPDEKRCE
jgi:hypothetical protein